MTTRTATKRPNTYQARAVNRQKYFFTEVIHFRLALLRAGTPAWFSVGQLGRGRPAKHLFGLNRASVKSRASLNRTGPSSSETKWLGAFQKHRAVNPAAIHSIPARAAPDRSSHSNRPGCSLGPTQTLAALGCQRFWSATRRGLASVERSQLGVPGWLRSGPKGFRRLWPGRR
jgi:hypothetical protein